MDKERQLSVIRLCIGLAVLCYIVTRAFTVGVTFDEVWTMHVFVPETVMHIINYTPTDANNHMLNTLLIKLLFALGNHSLFMARLPNVLAGCCYLYFGSKLTASWLPPLLGIGCYLLLVLNPFLLDFFSLARGYGLALGFQMASLYYFILWLREHQPKAAAWALGLGALAVLSNFSVLNYWAVLLLVINGVSLALRKQFRLSKTLVYSGIIALVLLALMYEPVRKLKEAGSLYYGGENGLYSDTLTSLVKYTLYSPNVTATTTIVLNSFLILCAVVLLAAVIHNRRLLAPAPVLGGIIALCLLAAVVQHLFMHTLYPLDRAALFLYPLFILLLACSLSAVRPHLQWPVATVCVLLFGVNFFSHANGYKTALWYFDADTKQILTRLNRLGTQKNKRLKIDFSCPFQSSVDYYMAQNQYPFIESIKKVGDLLALNDSADYYVYLAHSLEKVGYDTAQQKINSYRKDIDTDYQSKSIIIYTNLRK